MRGLTGSILSGRRDRTIKPEVCKNDGGTNILLFRVFSKRHLPNAVKMDLELLRARHPNACMNCDVNGRCEFQNLMYKYDIKQDPLGKMPRYV